MTLIVPPGYGLAAFTFTGAVGTQPYVTTMGVVLEGGTAAAVTSANGCFEAYRLNLLPETSSLLTLDRVQLYVGQDGPSGSVDSDLAPAPGTRSGSYPPTAMSAIARKVTAQFGRRGRGRMFLPGVVTESEVDQDGTIVVARRTTLNAALAAFLTDLEDITLGVGGAVLLHSSAPADPDPLTGLVVSDLVGWIRGRIR